MSRRPSTAWTLVVTSLAAFMVSLDNLVVTTALPQIRADLGAGLEGLEWTVNAYTLPFAVLLLTGAALGDRLGRRRVFLGGLTVFTIGSAAAALAPSIGALIAARAVQGIGAAFVLPLTLTLLAAAVPPERRGAALGIWGAMTGLAVAVGPLIGGAVTEGASWQWIFWVNVPVGLVALPIGMRALAESRVGSSRLDLTGVTLVSAGLFGVVFGLVRGESHGWTSTSVLAALIAGALGVAVFVAWELRIERRGGAPMLPIGLFRIRGFASVNATALLFSMGMFGSIFLLAQSLQNVYGYSPLEAGIRTLPWTAMPLLIAPLAGPVSDRIGGRPLLLAGLALNAIGLAWMGLILTVQLSYVALVGPFVVSGAGMALFFVPIATVALGVVPERYQGLASGTNNALRELGGVLGIAILSSVFAARGGYETPARFIDGTRPAVLLGAVAVAMALLAAVALPRRSAQAAPATDSAPPATQVPSPAADGTSAAAIGALRDAARDDGSATGRRRSVDRRGRACCRLTPHRPKRPDAVPFVSKASCGSSPGSCTGLRHDGVRAFVRSHGHGHRASPDGARQARAAQAVGSGRGVRPRAPACRCRPGRRNQRPSPRRPVRRRNRAATRPPRRRTAPRASAGNSLRTPCARRTTRGWRSHHCAGRRPGPRAPSHPTWDERSAHRARRRTRPNRGCRRTPA
ncbi:MFS transporter, DHA2 family, methylenomycin A resistance protein [Frankia sp. AiPs1]